MMKRRSRIFLFVLPSLAFGLAGAAPACAELVILTDGRFVKVKAYEVGEEQARLDLFYGGRMTVPIDRVERIVDDEYIPEPEPQPQEIAAMAALAETAVPPAIPLRFEESQPIPEGPYGALIYEAARKHQVNPQLVAALIRQESAGNVRAMSHKGARGLMQLMPSTAARFGVGSRDLFTATSNLEAGTRYLSWLIDHFDGQPELVIAAYNAGENAVARYGGVPPYRETRGYVDRVMKLLAGG
jgi:soluble lytic murein transglycosylase-like protein